VWKKSPAAGNIPSLERRMTAAKRFTFFRQSGWMAFATGLGGVFMWLVHKPAGVLLSKPEYGVFLALLQVMNLMLIPVIGLQIIVAQQTAAAITEGQRRQLAFTVRRLLAAVTGIWLVMALGVFVFRAEALRRLQIENPAALWLTVLVGLLMLWWPVLQGVLQGRQNYLWYGGLQTVNGAARFCGVLVVVGLLGGQAAGAVLAALFGFAVTVGVAAWHSRSVWLAPGEPVAGRPWLARVMPLTLGLAAGQFMMAADQLVVQSTFEGNVPAVYGAAGMIGRALIFFTAAVFAVMFPTIVASRARAEKSDVFALALGATAVLGVGAALGCTLLPELPLRLIYGTKYLASAPLVPWFVWGMLPLTLANVLVGNLLAHERFAAVPWLLLVAAGYGVTLWLRVPAFQAAEQWTAFKMIVHTLGLFSLLLLAVSAWFTWGPAAKTQRSARA
jgi:O-antigen/teichoic acid export membrane protein